MPQPAILCCDPGFAAFGFSLLTFPDPTTIHVPELGVILTQKSDKKAKILATDDNFRRTQDIVHSLARLLANPTYDVIAVCAESFSPPRSSSVAAKVAFTWGALIAMLTERRIPLVQVSPQEVKKRVHGARSASKDQIAFNVRQQFGSWLLVRLAELPEGVHEHIYDSLAVGIACLSSDVIQLARRRAA